MTTIITRHEAIKLLRNNWLNGSYRGKVLGLYLVGSRARGTHTGSSDIDIAVIIPPKQRKTSLKFSEEYHAKANRRTAQAIAALRPKHKDLPVDFQFFYPGEIDTYTKIELT